MASQLNVDVIVAQSTTDVQINDSLDVTGAMDVDGATTLNSTLDVDGATTLNGAVTLGNAAGDAVTVTGTVASNLIFTDATYDIGAAAATRPRDLHLSRTALVGTSIELGHATDTTITRESAGVAAIEGAAILVDTITTTVADMIYASAANTPVRLSQGAEMWMPTSGRLTLTTAVPVTISDVTAATTVYFTPYKGNVIQLYDGTSWLPYVFTELSQATTDNTKSPAAVGASSNYDVFVWNDSGTLRATRGPAWTSDTARGTGAGTTELSVTEGRYMNANAITNGPGASRGLYVGSIRSNSSSQINDSLALRHVWNNYNRVPRSMYVSDSTDSWVYTTATIRQANASAVNQLDVMIGLSEDLVRVDVTGSFSNTDAQAAGHILIGLDSTTTAVTGFHHGFVEAAVAGAAVMVYANWTGYPGIGRRTLVWLEYSDAEGTTTWSGDAGIPTRSQSGIRGEILA